MTIELPREIEIALLAQAEAEGVPLSQYVENLLRAQVLVADVTPLSPPELAAAWRESAKNLPLSPPLSDQAINRENLYRERG